jgi:sensor histidine kinase regulating citrate/malate metabolism
VIELLANAPALRSIDSYNEDWKFLFVSQVMCIIILYMQNELFKKSVIKHELEVMNLLWEKEQERYHLSKENIALMNQKSHDLKHQIRALRHMGKEEFDECLNEIEDNVNIYEAIVKTGNNVFDTILTEKSLYCKEHDIHVSCVADGSQMNFIATIDLYVILGNAMDNAIEAVEKFKEIEKRQIDVIIYRKQQFLIMNFINPIPETLVYEGKFPVTTKGDQRSHGFGLRSIWHLAKKYDGHIIVSEEDGCFSLKILIPIPKLEENDE